MDDMLEKPTQDMLEPYAGKWVAILRGKIISQGGTPGQALQSAQSIRYKEKFDIVYVPRKIMIQFPPILNKIRRLLPDDAEVYLVGGVVRDALRGHNSKDIDFILAEEAIPLAKRIADSLGGAYYPLKQELDVARVVLAEPDGERLFLDFSSLHGKTLDDDLSARDFTINAMAVRLHDPEKLYDPTGGVKDLIAGEIRACSVESFQTDPVRILRAVRQAALFGFKITPYTRKLMRKAAELLKEVSPERQRDELLRILSGPQPAAAIRALDLLGIQAYVFPEIENLKEIDQPPPHTQDVYLHTLAVIAKLEAVLDVLGPNHTPDGPANNLTFGQLSLRLGRFREQITAHINASFTPERTTRALLFLAALYHDAGKVDTKSVTGAGDIHFYRHEIVGSVIMDGRAHSLRLSNDEIHRVVTIVRHHMRPLMLTNSGEHLSRRAIYHFFRDTGEAGVDICILSLADFLGTYRVNVPQDKWGSHLDTIRVLLETWWELPKDRLNPNLFLNGKDIIDIFAIPPGPKIGEILKHLHELQAIGLVTTRADAIESINKYLTEN